MSDNVYKKYFDIDPSYYAAVTEDLIKSGKVQWQAFYPHDTFITLLEKTHKMLSGSDARSLWVEGAYGTGKSHAALAVKSLLDANDNEIIAYFEKFGLKRDLRDKLIADKNNGTLLTVHRMGTSSIRSDKDLILEVQESISGELKRRGIKNRGAGSLRDAALRWFDEKETNRNHFNNLMHEPEYSFDFGNKGVNEIIDILKNSADEKLVNLTMQSILRVADDNGLTAFKLDIPALSNWIKSIINDNQLSGILFVWDEFTEFFQNNANSLTGFQTLVELSQSTPFYFLIVTHESTSLIPDKSARKKIMDRFVGSDTVRIEMPENMAFRLMAQAMKTTSDPVNKPKWQDYKGELNMNLGGVRNAIISSARKQSTMGQKTILSDNELQNIVPIHPYAALLLKHMSVAFNSNARSMFDFIISNDMTEARGFKWFIENYGPLDDTNLLTIDMLWDFFTGKDHSGLNSDVRKVLDSFNHLGKNSLLPDQIRVFKTVALLEAISRRVSDVELLRPNNQNIDLAFNGTDWAKGKACNIAAGLLQQKVLFKRQVANGMAEYSVKQGIDDGDKIDKIKEDIKKDTKTQDLIITADLMSAVKLPAAIASRYIMESAAEANLQQVSRKAASDNKGNHFKVIITFAQNDKEAGALKNAILKAAAQPNNELFYIECLTTMGNDLFEQYTENMARSRYYTAQDHQSAANYQNWAKENLTEWRQQISKGAFVLYTPLNKSGLRVPNLDTLLDELLKINRKDYYCGLEQFGMTDTMFSKSAMGQGAECGITQELKWAFKSSNPKTSLDKTLLNGVWRLDSEHARYWDDPGKRSKPIVQIKLKVEEIIKKGFDKSSGRVSIREIYDALTEAPFGFLPSNVSAFALGFVLKEYACDRYFWSNGSTSEPMTVDKMKHMISEIMSPHGVRYTDEYIVTMSDTLRKFLECTSEAFGIPREQCDSVEHARDQVRIKMRGLTFPIWCLKSILDTQQERHMRLAEVIDAYCGIANTANSSKATESSLAEKIGNLVIKDPTVIKDLKNVLTNDMCLKGMAKYIAKNHGELKSLASEIGDNGAYLSQVKQKFTADAANWVWNIETADEKIRDVILEYRIIYESNKSQFMSRCTRLDQVVHAWNERVNNICIPYEILKDYAGELELILSRLYDIKNTGRLNNPQKFYEALTAQLEDFDRLYSDQLPYFEQAIAAFTEELSEQDIGEIFKKVQAGQFTKSRTMYENYIRELVNGYIRTRLVTQLHELWREKTGTDSPSDWSDKYGTPILCVLSENERSEARECFAAFNSGGSDTVITKALEYLRSRPDAFYKRLNDPVTRDKCFMTSVVGEFQVLLTDVDVIRAALRKDVRDRAYNWGDSSAVRNCLNKLADEQYKIGGYKRVLSILNNMDEATRSSYLEDLIAKNFTVGMAILMGERAKG